MLEQFEKIGKDALAQLADVSVVVSRGLPSEGAQSSPPPQADKSINAGIRIRVLRWVI